MNSTIQGQMERPMLFSGPMVRAILENRKTQTRRIVKPQPQLQLFDHSFTWIEGGVSADTSKGWPCPYGVAGDRLWVRETWFDLRAWERATGLRSGEKEDFQYRADFDLPPESKVKWKPSIRMPRRASRITLRITKVRVERLQDISEEDAKAEGVAAISMEMDYDTRKKYDAIMKRFGQGSHFRTGFRILWDSIHGEGAWLENPWVWVIEFCHERIAEVERNEVR